jgi:hypothetical protein
MTSLKVWTSEQALRTATVVSDGQAHYAVLNEKKWADNDSSLGTMTKVAVLHPERTNYLQIHFTVFQWRCLSCAGLEGFTY